MTSTALPETPEIRALLGIALDGTDINIERITTTAHCLHAIDQARRPFPADLDLSETEHRRLDAVLRLVCLVGHANAISEPGLANKEAARLFRDFADGVPVTEARMMRHQALSKLRVVPGGK